MITDTVRRITVLLVVVLLSGCAGTVEKQVGVEKKIFRKPVDTSLNRKPSKEEIAVRSLERLLERVKSSPEDALQGLPPVSLHLREVAFTVFADVVREQTGWDVVYPSSLVSLRVGPVNCSNCRLGDLVRRLCEKYDLAVSVDYRAKRIVFRDEITETFVIPLIDTEREEKSELKVESTTGTSSTSGWELKAPEAEISVKHEVKDDGIWKVIVENIKKIAGKEAVVLSNPLLSTITVRGKPSAVRRVREYVKTLRELLTIQISFDITVYEVVLSSSFSSGIEWNKVFAEFLKGANLVVSGGRTITSPFAVFTLLSVKEPVSKILLQLLSEYGEVYVVSQPHLVIQNGYSSFFSSGRVVPYVRTVHRQYYGETHEEVITPEMTATHEGIIFALSCRVVDRDRVLVSISPVMSTITGWREFVFPGVEFENPEVAQKEFTTRAIVKDGATLIIGGIQINTRTKDKSGPAVPGVGNIFSSRKDSAGRAELVVAITPHIVREMETLSFAQ